MKTPESADQQKTAVEENNLPGNSSSFPALVWLYTRTEAATLCQSGKDNKEVYESSDKTINA